MDSVDYEAERPIFPRAIYTQKSASRAQEERPSKHSIKDGNRDLMGEFRSAAASWRADVSPGKPASRSIYGVDSLQIHPGADCGTSGRLAQGRMQAWLTEAKSAPMTISVQSVDPTPRLERHHEFSNKLHGRKDEPSTANGEAEGTDYRKDIEHLQQEAPLRPKLNAINHSGAFKEKENLSSFSEQIPTTCRIAPSVGFVATFSRFDRLSTSARTSKEVSSALTRESGLGKKVMGNHLTASTLDGPRALQEHHFSDGVAASQTSTIARAKSKVAPTAGFVETFTKYDRLSSSARLATKPYSHGLADAYRIKASSTFPAFELLAAQQHELLEVIPESISGSTTHPVAAAGFVATYTKHDRLSASARQTFGGSESKLHDVRMSTATVTQLGTGNATATRLVEQGSAFDDANRNNDENMHMYFAADHARRYSTADHGQASHSVRKVGAEFTDQSNKSFSHLLKRPGAHEANLASARQAQLPPKPPRVPRKSTTNKDGRVKKPVVQYDQQQQQTNMEAGSVQYGPAAADDKATLRNTRVRMQPMATDVKVIRLVSTSTDPSGAGAADGQGSAVNPPPGSDDVLWDVNWQMQHQPQNTVTQAKLETRRLILPLSPPKSWRHKSDDQQAHQNPHHHDSTPSVSSMIGRGYSDAVLATSSTSSSSPPHNAHGDADDVQRMHACTPWFTSQDLNSFLRERRRSLLAFNPTGELMGFGFKIFKSRYNPGLSSVVSTICYAWLLENTTGKAGLHMWRTVPVIDKGRQSVLRENIQASWLLQCGLIDTTALLFSDEIDVEGIVCSGHGRVRTEGLDFLNTHGKVASRCTILAEMYAEMAPHLLKTTINLKTLLLAGLLLDTNNFTTFYTARDEAVAALCSDGAAPYGLSGLFSQIDPAARR